MRAIFISYRREDAEGQAGRLFADLVKHFGEQAVFMDVATIEPGRDFRKAIDEHVGSCGVLLSLIGKDWLDAKDAGGQRRLDDESDFVRLETSSALKRDIPVVPVLVHGARMPKKEQLPADLQDLAYRNAIELTHARWDSDLTVLIKALSRYITPANAAVAEPARPAPPAAASSGGASNSKMLMVAGAVVLAIVVGAFFYLSSGKVEPQVTTLTKEPAADSPTTKADVPLPSPDLPPREAPKKPAPKADQPQEQPAPPAAAPARGPERNTLFGVTDWDHDGHQDIVSRQNSTADLWLYPGQSQRAPSTTEPVVIGVGWKGITFFGAGDWDGDGHQDLVVRNDTSGDLVLYPGEGVRRMSNIQPIQIGNGWKGFTFVGMGDWDGDGHLDIVTRNDTTGDLMLYPGEGVRRMSRIDPSKIGFKWNGLSFFGMADWDLDGHQDIVLRNDSTGDLMLYAGDGSRTQSRLPHVRIAVGFDLRQ